jgi:hypothetical protein
VGLKFSAYLVLFTMDSPETGEADHRVFLETTNLKTKPVTLLIEEFYWFTVANVAPKTLTPTPTVQTAAHPSTQSVNATREATENTTDEWKTNASACQTAA